jgi:elongation factor Ts
MADISLDAIKELRAKSGVGIHKVKEALKETDGDMEEAMIYLREKGMAKAAKRSGNATNNGMIGHYIHGNGIGILVEIQSETDFASGSEKFQEFAKELAMHVAAKSPEYIDIDSIPEKVIETEKKVYAKDLEGKPENIQEKILEGKLAKFYEDVVLMEQDYVRDEDKKIKDLLNELIAALGERIVIKKFVRMELGGDHIIAEKSE